MLQHDLKFYIRQEHSKNLLQQAAKERLIRDAKLHQPKKRTIPRTLILWLGAHMVQWGCLLQQRSTVAPACLQCQG